LEPLQENSEQLVIDIDVAKLNIKRIDLEGVELLQNLVTTQLVEIMAERSILAQAQCQRITEMYDALAQAVTDVGVRQ